jgi:hypothetical protein
MRLSNTPHYFVDIVCCYVFEVIGGVVWLQSTKNKVGDSVA